jgi:hypothetical protein
MPSRQETRAVICSLLILPPRQRESIERGKIILRVEKFVWNQRQTITAPKFVSWLPEEIR